MTENKLFDNVLTAIKNQVLENPDKTAVFSDDIKFTYSSLDILSNKIANYITDCGLQCTNIGISLHRGPDIIISILGILKARCAYVFMDPKYPVERQKYVLENSDTRLLITSDDNNELTKVNGITFTTFDDILNKVTNSDNPDISVKTSDHAYIMYTSGSTGRPKGVEISHANVVSYLNALMPQLEINESDIYLHTASFSFSSSVRQYMIPLVNGISVYVAGDDEVASLIKLLDTVKNKGITIFDTIQSLWRYGLKQIESLDYNNKEQLIHSSLRLLLFSGDKLPASLVQQIKVLFKNRLKIINVYGQTECIGALTYKIPDDFGKQEGIVPVGYPLGNTKISVLDENLNHVMEGETGELYIESPSISSGYYKNSMLTDKAFINISTKDNKPSRMLKSGDIIRYWKNAPLEIIGRTDFQVKIRGIRIDVDEVEKVIIQHPSVSESIVLGLSNGEAEPKLVGFIVGNKGHSVDYNDLNNFLKRFLPSSYIPEKIFTIDKIPLTPNGKTDRKSLQSMAKEIFEASGGNTELIFENEVQKILFYSFVDVLGTTDFTVEDNFFDIGGHSLKAVELTEILERIFNKTIPIEIIYKYPSIEKLSSVIDEIKIETGSTNLVAISPEGDKIPFICVHGDDANFLLPKYMDDKIPFYGYFHQGRAGEKINYTSIRSIATKYVEELFQLKPEGPYILGGYSIGGVIAFDMVNIIRKAGKEVKLLVIIDAESPQYEGKKVQGRNIFFSKKVEIYGNETDDRDEISSRHRIMSSVKHHFEKVRYYFARLLAYLNIKVPLSIRNNYIIGIYRDARKNYFPESVSVNTLIIRSTINNFEDYNLGWERFIKGKITTYEIDSDHNNIIKEPRVSKLADIIKSNIIKISEPLSSEQSIFQK
ncbi:MAG: amino acid adenylation domain-containing protein [Bacteroidales bacterium]|nr:amino acid adenylation domain-containing protein [Bacteroidales bacterium]